MLKSGSDIGGCGRTPDSACSTLLYLLHQVNRTHLPPSTATQVPPSREMDPDYQTQVGPVKDIDPVNRTQAPPFMDNHPDDWTQVPPSMDIDPDNQTQVGPVKDINPDNQTQLPPSKDIDPNNQTYALDIITDKDLNIDQQTAVSTLFFIITSNHRQMWLPN